MITIKFEEQYNYKDDYVLVLKNLRSNPFKLNDVIDLKGRMIELVDEQKIIEQDNSIVFIYEFTYI